MRARCATSRLQSARRSRGGDLIRTEHDLVPGREYLVFGLSVWRSEVWLEVESDGGFLYSVPLSEFDLVKGRPSRYWELRVESDGVTTLWPPELRTPFFHADLAEREPTAVAAFAKLKRQLEVEGDF